MLEEIKKIERRTFRKRFEDGVIEIVLGIIGLLIGLYFFGYSLTPKKLVYALAWFLGTIPVGLLIAFLSKNLVLSLKEKFTWPRTGFVSYQDRKKRRWEAGIRGAIFGFCTPLLAGLMEFIFGNPRFDAYPAFFGFVNLAIYFWISFRSGLARFAVLGGLYAVVGIFLSLAGWEHLLSMSAFFGSFGILSLVSGLIASRRFLRRNPLPAEAGK